MQLEIVGLTLDVVGTLMIAFAALRVHHRVLNKHKMDKCVFRAMKKEQVIGIFGAVLVITGYLVQIYSF